MTKRIRKMPELAQGDNMALTIGTATYTTPKCPVCLTATPVVLEAEKFLRWQSGSLIQDVWPEKSADWRELLMSGTHAECWDEMMKDVE